MAMVWVGGGEGGAAGDPGLVSEWWWAAEVRVMVCAGRVVAGVGARFLQRVELEEHNGRGNAVGDGGLRM